MMRGLFWLTFGLVALAVWGALASRLSVFHLVPNVAWILVAFVALRRSLVTSLVVALVVGHQLGLESGAPPGLMAVTTTWGSLATALLGRSLTGQGASYFALVCGLGDALSTLLSAGLLIWHRQDVGFSSWATAMLLPQAAATALCGLALFFPLCWVEARLAPRTVQGLSWHR